MRWENGIDSTELLHLLRQAEVNQGFEQLVDHAQSLLDTGSPVEDAFTGLREVWEPANPMGSDIATALALATFRIALRTESEGGDPEW